MMSCFSTNPSCPPSNYTLCSSHGMYVWNHSYPAQNCTSGSLPFPGLNPENKGSSAKDSWGNVCCDPWWQNFCRVLQTLGQRPSRKSKDNGVDGTWRPRRGGFLDPASRILQRLEPVKPTVNQMDAPWVRIGRSLQLWEIHSQGGRQGEEVFLDNRVHDMLIFYVNTSSWLQWQGSVINYLL